MIQRASHQFARTVKFATFLDAIVNFEFADARLRSGEVQLVELVVLLSSCRRAKLAEVRRVHVVMHCAES